MVDVNLHASKGLKKLRTDRIADHTKDNGDLSELCLSIPYQLHSPLSQRPGLAGATDLTNMGQFSVFL